jgi:hypothetical protein
MSSLESLISTAGESEMPDSLTFALPPASTAVVDRRQHVRAYPTSASTLTPTGTRTCRIRLGGDDFVDASSIRLMFTINNLDGTNEWEPECGPWGIWSQVYLRSNGVELDNIPMYGRFHQQYGWNQLTLEQQYGEAAIAGIGGSWPEGSGPNAPQPENGTIDANTSLTVMHKVYTSLFSSGKLLPTRYAPLELEMTLNSTLADYINTGSGLSTNFSISNVQLLYDAYVLDESVQESFYKALLSNRTLAIPTMTVYQTVQSIPADSTSFSFSSVRAFSRLSHVWLTFRNTYGRAWSFVCPTAPDGIGENPSLSDGGCPSVRLSIGPHNWPDGQPASSIPELFYMFQKALPGTPFITRDQYQTSGKGFTIAFDVRRVPSDPTSSISTRSGDLLRVDLTNLTANRATECWMTLFAFSVTSIRESGVTLLT